MRWIDAGSRKTDRQVCFFLWTGIECFTRLRCGSPYWHIHVDKSVSVLAASCPFNSSPNWHNWRSLPGSSGWGLGLGYPTTPWPWVPLMRTWKLTHDDLAGSLWFFPTMPSFDVRSGLLSHGLTSEDFQVNLKVTTWNTWGEVRPHRRSSRLPLSVHTWGPPSLEGVEQPVQLVWTPGRVISQWWRSVLCWGADVPPLLTSCLLSQVRSDESNQTHNKEGDIWKPFIWLTSAIFCCSWASDNQHWQHLMQRLTGFHFCMARGSQLLKSAWLKLRFQPRKNTF